MGSISGRKLNRVIDNLEYILGIELMSASQAIEFRRPLKSSPILEFAHEYVRKYVGFANEDRIFARDIDMLTAIIRDGSLVENVRNFASGSGIKLNEGFENFQL
jgi:histidine ammonia-lyase